jgi:hypothetical protein
MDCTDVLAISYPASVAEIEMCWRCPTPMAFVHGTWQCPRCKFKLGCCEGEAQTNCDVQPAVATPSTART